MLASLASQAATSGGLANGVIALAIAATTLVLMLTSTAMLLATASERRLAAIRTQGAHVKRVAGVLLITIGLWFAYLALANPTYLLP